LQIGWIWGFRLKNEFDNLFSFGNDKL